MSLFRWVIRPYLYSQYMFQKLARKGTFGGDQAIYIKTAYKNTGNGLKDGLFRHHVKQFHEASCSVASVVSVVNTLLDRQGHLNGTPLCQQNLLESVRTAHWKERMSDNGYNGRRGLPLQTLGQVVETSLKVYGISYQSLETVQASRDPIKSRKIKDRLRARLEQFETAGNCLIISHFDQGCFVRDLHIPHISPVGGFDPESGTVTLLDVDPSQECPYQVSFDLFYKGLSSNYNPIFRRFGYGEGGYVFIRV
ncbi:phytochelatin synthase family protein [Desulfobacula phenolica]|uniref:glutathione gamma-glutamylcysteinyltransferase n=1 Tax=Desulfobacula phenolica TaxID=90732 RepID=A0A1H2IRU6_9BACT|nr:phytochelatin synthase family protein [Desulfobacula phenolica]SDU46874.1 Phytochelatin synthase [Desulfobacula phenolica]